MRRNCGLISCTGQQKRRKTADRLLTIRGEVMVAAVVAVAMVMTAKMLTCHFSAGAPAPPLGVSRQDQVLEILRNFQ